MVTAADPGPSDLFLTKTRSRRTPAWGESRSRWVAVGAVLAHPASCSPIYFVNAGMKRRVTSPAAMDRYRFNRKRLYSMLPSC
jgi:hypothetical protein